MLSTKDNLDNCLLLYDSLRVVILIMMFIRHTKWFYAAAGSGIAFGVFNYLQSEKTYVQTSWHENHKPSVKWNYNWDKRELSSMIEPAKNENDPSEQNRINEQRKILMPTATRNIILIRHGQYEIEEKEEKNMKLTALGRKQADYVGKRLKELGITYTNLTRSTMIRAIETSDIILKHLPKLPVETDDLLKEGSPIPPEPPVGNWRPENHFFKDGKRIEAAFRKYFHRADGSQKSDSFEIVVCHANVIRYFICRVLQFPPEAWLRFSLRHCSITWIVIFPNGRVGVKCIGDYGFMPKEALSSII